MFKLTWSEVTWYSKLLAVLLFVWSVCGAFYFGTWYQQQLSSSVQSASFAAQDEWSTPDNSFSDVSTPVITQEESPASVSSQMLPKKAGAFHIAEKGLVLAGATTISGTVEENEMIGRIGFHVIDADLYKIPQVEGLFSPKWFCFSNDTQARAALSGKTGIQTIRIQGYQIDRRPTETCDQTEFVGIVNGQ